MKLQIRNNQKYKLLKLNLLKSLQISKKFNGSFRNVFTPIFTHTKVISLKKVINIIYYFHNSNSKILFLGIPQTNTPFFKKLTQKTKHYYFPFPVNFKYIVQKKRRGSFMNNKFFFTKEDFLRKLKLIVLMDDYVEKRFLKEILKLHIPIIYLNSCMVSSLLDEKDNTINHLGLTIKQKAIWRLIVFSLLRNKKRKLRLSNLNKKLLKKKSSKQFKRFSLKASYFFNKSNRKKYSIIKNQNL